VRNHGELHGIMAEFRSPHEVVEAAKRVHAAGYTKVDAYSPYPIEELTEALDFHKSHLPKIVLAGGVFGFLAGWGLEHYADVSGRQVDDIDYYVVLAKWKLAVVLEQGFQRAGDDEKLQAFGPIVLDLMQGAAELAEASDYRS
jgi:hypothetical protein